MPSLLVRQAPLALLPRRQRRGVGGVGGSAGGVDHLADVSASVALMRRTAGAAAAPRGGAPHPVSVERLRYGEALGQLRRERGRGQSLLKQVLLTPDCPRSALRVACDAARVGVVLTDRSVATLLAVAAAGIRAASSHEVGVQLLQAEALPLHWQARERHVCGTLSLAGTIRCCAFARETDTALQLGDAAGRHFTSAVAQALLVACLTARCTARYAGAADAVWRSHKALGQPAPHACLLYLRILAHQGAAKEGAMVALVSEMQARDPSFLTLRHYEAALAGLHSMCAAVALVLRSMHSAFAPPTHPGRRGEGERGVSAGCAGPPPILCTTEPRVNAQVMRLLCGAGMLRDACSLALGQKAATGAVHGVLLERLMRRRDAGCGDLDEAAAAAAEVWIRTKLSSAGLPVPAPDAEPPAADPYQVATDADGGDAVDVDAASDKGLAAVIAVSSLVVAATSPLAAGAVGTAMALTSAARRPAKEGGFQEKGIAAVIAVSSLVVAGSSPLAAGAMGTAMAVSSAVASNFPAAGKEKPGGGDRNNGPSDEGL